MAIHSSGRRRRRLTARGLISGCASRWLWRVISLPLAPRHARSGCWLTSPYSGTSARRRRRRRSVIIQVLFRVIVSDGTISTDEGRLKSCQSNNIRLSTRKLDSKSIWALLEYSKRAIIWRCQRRLDSTSQDQHMGGCCQVLWDMDLGATVVGCWLRLKSFNFHLQVS